jgi:hypothetical protein
MPFNIKLGAVSCVFAAYLVGCVGEVPGYEEDPPADDTGEETPTEEQPPPEDQPPTTFAAAGWQLTAGTVGLAKAGKTCASLPAYTGTLSPANGTTIADVRITGTLHPQGTVTLQGVCLQGEIYQGSIIILDSEIIGPIPTQSRGFDGNQITIKNSYIHDVSVGIWFRSSQADKHVVLEGNVINSTSIAIETQSFYGTGSTAVIRGNRLIGASNSNPVVLLGSYQGAISGVTFERNLIEGPSTLLKVDGTTVTNVAAMDNRFTGGTNVALSTKWTTWSGNYLFSTTGTDGQGTLVAAP